MFSFGLVASSDAISGLSEGMDTFQMILDFINIIILFVICFLINYTTKFMFTKRSREFGMYLLLGIRRGKVIRMFLLEILLLGLFALALSFPRVHDQPGHLHDHCRRLRDPGSNLHHL